MTNERVWFSCLLAWLLAMACTNQEPSKAPCPADVAAGQSLACSCPDDGTLMGVTLCTEEMTLTACDCTNAVPVGSPAPNAGTDTPAAGAPAGPEAGNASPPPSATEPVPDAGAAIDLPVAGSAGSDSTGVGGEGGERGGGAAGGSPTGPSDAGADDDDEAALGSDAGPLPTDGKQLAVCESGRDCDQGYECFTDAPGPAFCSQACESDADCADIEGGSYTCYVPGSVCRIVCENAEDDAACPVGQICRFLNPLAGFRCAYPD